VKIWFPTIRAGSGGDVYVSRLASALRKKDISVEISWFDRRFEFLPSLLQGKRPPTGTDIIHANSWNAFAFKRKNIPLVVTEHHCVIDPTLHVHKSLYQSIYHKNVIKHFEQASFRRAQKIIAVSKYTANSLQRTFGLSDAEVIYNWVDTERFAPSSTFRNHDDKFRLLFVGNQSIRKGWDTIVRIMQVLDDDFQLAATTGLGERDRIETSTNILQLGRLSNDELVKAYQDCDALLFPSKYEGFGYAALEAMACGKPVIASDNSALPEVVSDGTTGFLCPPNDIDCFVSACKKLRADKTLRLELGKNARDRVLNDFLEEDLVRRYISVYKQLL
jgi:glycosyltransferase involved in cell wall biosynthesis